MSFPFSISRTWAVVRKEFIQMRRDRMTFAMMVGIPVVQLILFGFAINSDPKHLPTAVLAADSGPFSRDYIAALRNSAYFEVTKVADSEMEARDLLQRGDVKFVVTIPVNFNRDFVKGLRPAILLDADASDPMAIGNAVGAAEKLIDTAFNRDLTGNLRSSRGKASPARLILHQEFNPELITQYNTVPGLLGVILTLTMVFITALAITRETERGTMENLLSMPVKPLEVMLGKITPYILVGYVQVGLILLGAHYFFQVPFVGSLPLLLVASFFFISANLAVGVTFSTIARNQLQAVQMAIFFFLPSILLSGFMFPFLGMPIWAQWLGSILPLTHFNAIARGILLKGCSFHEIDHHFYCVLTFLVVVLIIGAFRYRRTLD